MREYELMVVLDLALAEADGQDAGPDLITRVVEARQGSVVKVDHWGRRRLAYPINGMLDADYVVTRVMLEPENVRELENVLKMNERILRHLVVRADELPIPRVREEPPRPAAAVAPDAEPAGEAAPVVAGELAADVSAAETVAADETAAETPGETPLAEEGAAQAPAVEAPVADADVTEAAATSETPVAEEAVAEAPAVETPVAEDAAPIEAEETTPAAEPVIEATPGATPDDETPGEEQNTTA